MATFPTVALVPIYSASPGNTDIPQAPAAGTLDEFPTLTRIGITDLVGPIAANMQEKSLERRTWTTRDRINALISGYNNLATYFLQRDGSTLPTANLPMGADGSGAGGYKLTFLAPGSSPYESVRYDQITPLAPKASPVFSGTITAPTAAVDFSTAAQVRVPTVSPGDNSTLAASTAFVTAAVAAAAAASSNKHKTFNASGTFTVVSSGWDGVTTFPPGTYSVTVVGAGGGGGGGGYNISNLARGGGGGGSGSTLIARVNLAAGSYTATVGAGGSTGAFGGFGFGGSAGSAGGSSSFSGSFGSFSSPGGGGGGGGPNSSGEGSGGSAGGATSGVPALHFSGQAGTASADSNGSTGGRGADSAYGYGGAGAPLSASPDLGAGGTGYGAGAGGGSPYNFGGGSGGGSGLGAPGVVILEYVV